MIVQMRPIAPFLIKNYESRPCRGGFLRLMLRENPQVLGISHLARTPYLCNRENNVTTALFFTPRNAFHNY
jgi:hypothetical protein